VSGLRIQFDPMPDETNERLSQLLADLGLTADPPAPPPNSAAHGSPLLPASAPQITWAPPPGPDAARAISAEAVRPALTPPPIVPLSSAGTSPPEDARLMVQIRGLLMELGDVQSRLESRERESVDLVSQVERLRLENRELRERLVRAEGQLQERHVKEGTARP